MDCKEELHGCTPPPTFPFHFGWDIFCGPKWARRLDGIFGLHGLQGRIAWTPPTPPHPPSILFWLDFFWVPKVGPMTGLHRWITWNWDLSGVGMGWIWGVLGWLGRGCGAGRAGGWMGGRGSEGQAGHHAVTQMHWLDSRCISPNEGAGHDHCPCYTKCQTHRNRNCWLGPQQK